MMRTTAHFLTSSSRLFLRSGRGIAEYGQNLLSWVCSGACTARASTLGIKAGVVCLCFDHDTLEGPHPDETCEQLSPHDDDRQRP